MSADFDVVDPGASESERAAEAALRPSQLSEFVGQRTVREQLSLVLQAAVGRGRTPDHVLLSGPPGLGKTTLSMIIAHEVGGALRLTSGPAIQNPGDLAAVLSSLQESDVLFIDEIHRLARTAEEMLYLAMEDFRVDLEYYSDGELATIVTRNAVKLGADLDSEAAEEIASRSRGTPRIANRLLRRVQDWAQVRGTGLLDLRAARAALDVFEVDGRGLDRLDRAVLDAVCRRFGGGPVGLATLAVAVGEEPETVETVVEPYLVREGFLVRTPRGRAATPLAFEHLNLPAPASGDTLFT